MRQIDAVIQHLKYKGPLTQLDALKLYGVGRLASRINDIKKLGLDVRKRDITVTKANGETTRVAEYFYGDGQWI